MFFCIAESFDEYTSQSTQLNVLSENVISDHSDGLLNVNHLDFDTDLEEALTETLPAEVNDKFYTFLFIRYCYYEC